MQEETRRKYIKLKSTVQSKQTFKLQCKHSLVKQSGHFNVWKERRPNSPRSLFWQAGKRVIESLKFLRKIRDFNLAFFVYMSTWLQSCAENPRNSTTGFRKTPGQKTITDSNHVDFSRPADRFCTLILPINITISNLGICKNSFHSNASIS